MANTATLYHKKTGMAVSCNIDQQDILKKNGYMDDAEKAEKLRAAKAASDDADDAEKAEKLRTAKAASDDSKKDSK